MKYAGMSDRLFSVPGTWGLRSCADPECACLWLDPRPVAKDIEVYEYHTRHSRSPAVERLLERTWGFMARAFLARRHHRDVAGTSALAGAALGPVLALAPDVGAELELLLRYLPPPRPGMKLLEVACGDGLALKVMSHVGWDVEGQDVDSEALALAAKRGLRVREGSLPDCDYPDGSFDAVTMCHVIEHIAEPEPLLRECLRILRPGGVLVCITPNVQSANLARFGASWLYLNPPRHLLLVSPPALHRIAQRVGFARSEVTSIVRAVQGTVVGSRNIERHGRHRWGDRGTVADRLAGRFRLHEGLWHRDGEALRGDELVLMAYKADAPTS